MGNCFRIVTDYYNGFEVQIKKRFLLWTYWKQCNEYGEDGVNSFAHIENAKEFIIKIKEYKSFKSEVVWISENCR